MNLGEAVQRCRACAFLIRGGGCGSKTARDTWHKNRRRKYVLSSPPITEVEACPKKESDAK